MASSTSRSGPTAPQFSPRSKPPLYFGVTRPIGTPVELVVNALKDDLKRAKYAVHDIRLSKLIDETLGFELDKAQPGANDSKFDHYVRLMKKGDFLRAGLGTAVMAELAIAAINERRSSDLLRESVSDGPGNAYLITSLVHPEEVDRLRDVYGSRFFLIGVNAPRSLRKRLLTDVLKSGASDGDAEAESLIQIDSGLKSSAENTQPRERLNVDRTFQEADVFVTVDTEPSKDPTVDTQVSRRDKKAISTIDRFVGQIFGFPFGTVSSDEFSMGQAYLAAKRSSALGRSVGSAITVRGEVISTGCNDVARAGGGLYQQGDEPDHRDHKVGFDPSDSYRIETMQGFLEVFFSAHDWVKSLDPSAIGVEGLKWFEALAETSARIGAPPASVVRRLPALEMFANSRISNLIEFGRSVHAEMAAVTNAASRGLEIQGASMFITTFPCHECSRNIIASGIDTVVYVEPYGKSLAEKLYSREISIFADPSESTIAKKVIFEPYVGIAPKRFDQLFSPVSRKSGIADGKDAGSNVGSAVEWSWANSLLRPTVLGYRLPSSAVGDNVRCVPDIEVALLAREGYYAERTRKALADLGQQLN